MRRYYDRYRQRSRGVGFFPLLILFVCTLAVLFLYRQTILDFLENNPNTAQYVPAFVTNALERDLQDWKQEDLQARYVQLSAEVKSWQGSLETAANQGQAKLQEVQTNLVEAKQALDETKAAIDKLSEAGANLKGSVSGSPSASTEVAE